MPPLRLQRYGAYQKNRFSAPVFSALAGAPVYLFSLQIHVPDSHQSTEIALLNPLPY
jgi:hypothetical protein